MAKVIVAGTGVPVIVADDLRGRLRRLVVVEVWRQEVQPKEYR